MVGPVICRSSTESCHGDSIPRMKDQIRVQSMTGDCDPCKVRFHMEQESEQTSNSLINGEMTNLFITQENSKQQHFRKARDTVTQHNVQGNLSAVCPNNRRQFSDGKASSATVLQGQTGSFFRSPTGPHLLSCHSYLESTPCKGEKMNQLKELHADKYDYKNEQQCDGKSFLCDSCGLLMCSDLLEKGTAVAHRMSDGKITPNKKISDDMKSTSFVQKTSSEKSLSLVQKSREEPPSDRLSVPDEKSTSNKLQRTDQNDKSFVLLSSDGKSTAFVLKSSNVKAFSQKVSENEGKAISYKQNVPDEKNYFLVLPPDGMSQLYKLPILPGKPSFSKPQKRVNKQYITEELTTSQKQRKLNTRFEAEKSEGSVPAESVQTYERTGSAIVDNRLEDKNCNEIPDKTQNEQEKHPFTKLRILSTGVKYSAQDSVFSEGSFSSLRYSLQDEQNTYTLLSPDREDNNATGLRCTASRLGRKLHSAKQSVEVNQKMALPHSSPLKDQNIEVFKHKRALPNSSPPKEQNSVIVNRKRALPHSSLATEQNSLISTFPRSVGIKKTRTLYDFSPEKEQNYVMGTVPNKGTINIKRALPNLNPAKKQNSPKCSAPKSCIINAKIDSGPAKELKGLVATAPQSGRISTHKDSGPVKELCSMVATAPQSRRISTHKDSGSVKELCSMVATAPQSGRISTHKDSGPVKELCSMVATAPQSRRISTHKDSGPVKELCSMVATAPQSGRISTHKDSGPVNELCSMMATAPQSRRISTHKDSGPVKELCSVVGTAPQSGRISTHKELCSMVATAPQSGRIRTHKDSGSVKELYSVFGTTPQSRRIRTHKNSCSVRELCSMESTAPVMGTVSRPNTICMKKDTAKGPVFCQPLPKPTENHLRSFSTNQISERNRLQSNGEKLKQLSKLVSKGAKFSDSFHSDNNKKQVKNVSNAGNTLPGNRMDGILSIKSNVLSNRTNIRGLSKYTRLKDDLLCEVSHLVLDRNIHDKMLEIVPKSNNDFNIQQEKKLSQSRLAVNMTESEPIMAIQSGRFDSKPQSHLRPPVIGEQRQIDTGSRIVIEKKSFDSTQSLIGNPRKTDTEMSTRGSDTRDVRQTRWSNTAEGIFGQLRKSSPDLGLFREPKGSDSGSNIPKLREGPCIIGKAIGVITEYGIVWEHGGFNTGPAKFWEQPRFDTERGIFLEQGRSDTEPGLVSRLSRSDTGLGLITKPRGTNTGPGLVSKPRGTDIGPGLVSKPRGTDTRPGLDSKPRGTDIGPGLVSKPRGTDIGPGLVSKPRGPDIGPGLVSKPRGTDTRPGLDSKPRGTDIGPGLVCKPRGPDTGPGLVSKSRGPDIGPGLVSKPRGTDTRPGLVSKSRGKDTGPSLVSKPRGTDIGPGLVSKPRGTDTGPGLVSKSRGTDIGGDLVKKPRRSDTGSGIVCKPGGLDTGPGLVSKPGGTDIGPGLVSKPRGTDIGPGLVSKPGGTDTGSGLVSKPRGTDTGPGGFWKQSAASRLLLVKELMQPDTESGIVVKHPKRRDVDTGILTELKQSDTELRMFGKPKGSDLPLSAVVETRGPDTVPDTQLQNTNGFDVIPDTLSVQKDSDTRSSVVWETRKSFSVEELPCYGVKEGDRPILHQTRPLLDHGGKDGCVINEYSASCECDRTSSNNLLIRILQHDQEVLTQQLNSLGGLVSYLDDTSLERCRQGSLDNRSLHLCRGQFLYKQAPKISYIGQNIVCQKLRIIAILKGKLLPALTQKLQEGSEKHRRKTLAETYRKRPKRKKLDTVPSQMQKSRRQQDEKAPKYAFGLVNMIQAHIKKKSRKAYQQRNSFISHSTLSEVFHASCKVQLPNKEVLTEGFQNSEAVIDGDVKTESGLDGTQREQLLKGKGDKKTIGNKVDKKLDYFGNVCSILPDSAPQVASPVVSNTQNFDKITFAWEQTEGIFPDKYDGHKIKDCHPCSSVDRKSATHLPPRNLQLCNTAEVVNYQWEPECNVTKNGGPKTNLQLCNTTEMANFLCEPEHNVTNSFLYPHKPQCTLNNGCATVSTVSYPVCPAENQVIRGREEGHTDMYVDIVENVTITERPYSEGCHPRENSDQNIQLQNTQYDKSTSRSSGFQGNMSSSSFGSHNHPEGHLDDVKPLTIQETEISSSLETNWKILCREFKDSFDLGCKKLHADVPLYCGGGQQSEPCSSVLENSSNMANKEEDRSVVMETRKMDHSFMQQILKLVNETFDKTTEVSNTNTTYQDISVSSDCGTFHSILDTEQNGQSSSANKTSDPFNCSDNFVKDDVKIEGTENDSSSDLEDLEYMEKV